MELRSQRLWDESLALFPGGVNSPARSFRAVGGGVPVMVRRGRGAYVWDVDGHRYIDYLAAFGPGILGHAHPEMNERLREAIEHGVLFGTPTAGEAELGRRLTTLIPGLDRLRFVTTGTEAVMSAVRLARHATGRPLLLTFRGHYHGHSDAVLKGEAGSGVATTGTPIQGGAAGGDVLSLPYNDLPALEEALERHGPRVAAVLMEPVGANMGIVAPREGYLQEVARLARRAGALLILDEVITAFRLHFGTAAALYGVEPDLICFGKIIGGGLPLAAYGGRRDLMMQVAPEGPVFQAGTHAGNPLSVAAGVRALELLERPGTYENLERLSSRLADGLVAEAGRQAIPVQVNRLGSMFTLFFGEGAVVDFETAKGTDHAAFARFFRAILAEGILLPPSPYEAWFLSIAHSEEDVESTLAAAARAFARMQAPEPPAGEE